jgi:hypothetical protein
MRQECRWALYCPRHNFKFKIKSEARVGAKSLAGDVMRALNGRDRRARRGRYFLRDLAGFAGVERLLAHDAGGEHHSLDAADDAHADAIASSVAPRPQLGTGRPAPFRPADKPSGTVR